MRYEMWRRTEGFIKFYVISNLMVLELGLGIGLVKKNPASRKRIFQTVLLIKLRNSRITFNLWLIQLLREKEFIEDIHELQKELYYHTIEIIQVDA